MATQDADGLTRTSDTVGAEKTEGNFKPLPMVNSVQATKAGRGSCSSSGVPANLSSNVTSPAAGAKPAASGGGVGCKEGGAAGVATQDADGLTRTSDTVGAEKTEGNFKPLPKVNSVQATKAVRCALRSATDLHYVPPADIRALRSVLDSQSGPSL